MQTVGVEAGDGLRDAGVRASAADDADVTSLHPCGLGCFVGAVTIPAAATWTLAVHITSNRGPIDVAVTAPLPAPSGRPTLARALSAMDHLSSATMTEQLRHATDNRPLVADYRFRAPDTFAYTLGGTERATVGDHTYERDQPGGAWTTEQGGDFSWPAGYFASFWGPGIAARVIGQDQVDGHDTDVVAFLRPELPAWFRVWVDGKDGLVRREEMRAEGHIMDHRWTGFDQPVDIAVPP